MHAPTFRRTARPPLPGRAVPRVVPRRCASLLWLAAPLILGGCATSPSPAWDARFGEALRVLQAGQLIAPDAPTRHGQTVPPSDGRSVHEAMQRLTDSYRHPPSTSVGPTGSAAASVAR